MLGSLVPGSIPGHSMEDVVTVQCPYCFQIVEIDLDPETHGTFVQDCEVCCRPWNVAVQYKADGTASVSVTALDQ